jgi:polysaccharide export outer membrane protein
MRRSAALALVAPLLASACRWARAAPLARGNAESRVSEAVWEELVLAPGDRLSVVVFRHPEVSTPEQGVLVDAEGRLDLPLVGPIAVAGLTAEAARVRLTHELGRYLREPRVSLNLLEPRGRRVYVFGEVERPGAYALDRPLTALEALTLAGGFRPGADRDQVALLRGTREALQVHYFDGATPGPDGMVSVHADDFLFVRLSGAGTFREQILPFVQGIVPPLTGLASLIVLTDRLDE